MRRTLSRLAVAGASAALLLTGCGLDVQTLQPYTPADGINVEQGAVKVLNLLVVANGTGQGVVSATIVSGTATQLTAISGTPHKADNSNGTPLAVTATGLPMAVPANSSVLLTQPPNHVGVSSTDLKPGLLVDVTLTFSGGVQVRGLTPVQDAAWPEYAEIGRLIGTSPSPAP